MVAKWSTQGIGNMDDSLMITHVIMEIMADAETDIVVRENKYEDSYPIRMNK